MFKKRGKKTTKNDNEKKVIPGVGFEHTRTIRVHWNLSPTP